MIDWSIKPASWNRFRLPVRVGPTIEVRYETVIVDGVEYPIPESLQGRVVVLSVGIIRIGEYQLIDGEWTKWTKSF